MKKQNVLNLVKYYVENNDSAFRNEVMTIADDFEQNGEYDISQYLMNLISTTNFYRPQNNYSNFNFLHKQELRNTPLYLPEKITDDILGIVKSSSKNIRISKILFYGKPGTGKTESAYQIARLMNRDLLSVKIEDLIDSHLGQTSKNIVSLLQSEQQKRLVVQLVALTWGRRGIFIKSDVIQIEKNLLIVIIIV